MRYGGNTTGLIALNLAGLAALALGVALLQGSDVAFTPGGAAAGVLSQLPTTLPAAVLVLASSGVNLLAGATAVRLVQRRPFGSISSLLLWGLVGAVLLDTAALMLLGGLGFFRWPVVAGLHAAALVVAWRARPLLAERPRLTSRVVPAGWLLIGVVWSAPVVMQLASPVAPFIDVLPNHVAPVEHLRTFGSYETLTTAPSPIYGPSRMFLGYVAVLGMLSTLTTLPAVLTVAAFILPMTVLLALAARRLAVAVFGRGAAYWALLVVPLSVVFLRLPDARATVLVFALLSLGLAVAVEASARRPQPPNTDVLLGAALGAAILIHPVMGALATGTVLVLALWSPPLTPVALPALAVAAVLALPQAILMLGVDVPSWAGLGVAPLAVAVAYGARRLAERIRLPPLTVASIPVVVIVLGLVIYAPRAIPALADVASDAVSRFGLLAIAALLGATLAARRGRWQLPLAALTVWLAAGMVAQLVPPGSVLTDSLRFEMPKTLAYWWSWLAAPIAAVALAEAWRGRGWVRAAGPTLVGVFVVCAVMPLREEPVGPNDHAEYRMAESLSVALHHAERGYWVGYPDSRTLVNDAQQELLAALREEIAAGRLDAGTRVLHVAVSFQQWASTPLGVFAGVIETDVTLDPEESIHTVGGRLHGVGELARLLATDDYRFVILEPVGLDPGLRRIVSDAGYDSVFANARGEIFAAPGAQAD